MILKNNNQKIELEEFNINEDVKQVLLGSLLGDGSSQIQKEGKNAFFREIHGAKQKDYIIWKNNFLKIFNTKLHEYSIYDKRTNKTYYSILLWSKTHPVLTYYHGILYRNGKKIISKELLNNIGILGLAVWYMDDGYYHYGDYRCAFGTDCYSYVDHVIIRDWLKEKFGVKAQIHGRSKNNVNRYTIVLSKNETDRFLKMIEPYIITSMYYKLGHIKEENKFKIDKHNDGRKEYRKLEYQRNKEKHYKHNKEYYQANKERICKQKKNYRLRNKEELLKWAKNYYIKNRDTIRKKQRLRRQNNIEKYKERDRKYYYANRTQILKKAKEYLKHNREIINKRRREKYKKKKEDMKNEDFPRYSFSSRNKDR